jgi:hypothetical protein
MLANIDSLEKELETLNTREVREMISLKDKFDIFFYFKKKLNDELSILLANEESFERQMLSIKNLVFVFSNPKK